MRANRQTKNDVPFNDVAKQAKVAHNKAIRQYGNEAIRQMSSAMCYVS